MSQKKKQEFAIKERCPCCGGSLGLSTVLTKQHGRFPELETQRRVDGWCAHLYCSSDNCGFCMFSAGPHENEREAVIDAESMAGRHERT